MRKRNLVFGYVCLVGIPLLALIVILDVGHDLRAPIRVAGNWDIQADLQSLPAAACGAVFQPGGPRLLSIAQSGRYLTVTFGRLQGPGKLQDAALSGDLLPAADACGIPTRPAILRAGLERSANQEILRGILEWNGCARCPAIPFRATRRHPSAMAAQR